MPEQIANFGHTTLNGAINASVTSLTATAGSVFPADGDFRIQLGSELMKVTARSTNVLTVERGSEGTTATSHSDGVAIDARLTRDGITQMVYENSPESGTSFPGSPGTGDRFRRSDLDYMIFMYDGTRWVSEQIFSVQYSLDSGRSTNLINVATAAVEGVYAINNGLDVYVMDITFNYFAGSPLNGSNYWNARFRALHAGIIDNTFTLAASTGSTSSYNSKSAVIDTVVGALAAFLFDFAFTKTGSPGALSVASAGLRYRIVAT